MHADEAVEHGAPAAADVEDVSAANGTNRSAK